MCAQAVPVRCLSPLDTLRAGVEAGAPPSILPGGAGIDLYFSDLEGSDFDVLYAALAAGIRPVLLVVEHSHRKGWDGDVALLRDAHGYVLAGHDQADAVFLDARRALRLPDGTEAAAGVPGCLLARWKLRNHRNPARHIYEEDLP